METDRDGTGTPNSPYEVSRARLASLLRFFLSLAIIFSNLPKIQQMQSDERRGFV